MYSDGAPRRTRTLSSTHPLLTTAARILDSVTSHSSVIRHQLFNVIVTRVFVLLASTEHPHDTDAAQLSLLVRMSVLKCLTSVGTHIHSITTLAQHSGASL